MSLFFISTNPMWGGSEELWVSSARLLKKQNYDVTISVLYEHERLREIACDRLEYFSKFKIPPLFDRILLKFKVIKPIKPLQRLQTQITKLKPDLVIISQGNSLAAIDIMLLCAELKVAYVTITQLVAELNYQNIEGENVFGIRKAYSGALRNFFVSKNNLLLHQQMLAMDLENAVVIYNPCKVKGKLIPSFPNTRTFAVAIVGRLECFHKGCDLVLHLASAEKWRNRNIEFNFYGSGPHKVILEDTVSRHGITNVFIKDHYDVIDIWKENHILLMASRMEGQSLALIEAMWCKRTAVVTNTGGASELIKENVNGFIAETASVDALDLAMERAWEQREEWEQLGIAASETIRQLHPEDEVAYFCNQIIPTL